jgi:hypothetical protein
LNTYVDAAGMGLPRQRFVRLGKRDQKIMSAIATKSTRETMRKHAAFQVSTKRLLDKSRGRVMIALPVKLAAAS